MEIRDFRFLTPLVLRREVHRVGSMGDEFRVHARYRFSYLRDGGRIRRGVPTYKDFPEFTTDGASVPEAFQWAIPKFGPHLEAAFVHDACYWFGRNGHWQDMTREEADRIFDRALAVTENVSDLQRFAMFEAVKAFGRSVWDDGTDWGATVPDQEQDPDIVD